MTTPDLPATRQPRATPFHQAHRRPRPNKVCLACGQQFYAQPSRFAQRIYCSIACRYAVKGWESPRSRRVGNRAPNAPDWIGSLTGALMLVEAQLAEASDARAMLLEIERDALRWCLDHPLQTHLAVDAAVDA